MHGEIFVNLRVSMQMCFPVNFEVAFAVDIPTSRDSTRCGDFAVNVNIFSVHGLTNDNCRAVRIDARIFHGVLGEFLDDVLACFVDIVHGGISLAFGNVIGICLGI